MTDPTKFPDPDEQCDLPTAKSLAAMRFRARDFAFANSMDVTFEDLEKAFLDVQVKSVTDVYRQARLAKMPYKRRMARRSSLRGIDWFELFDAIDATIVEYVARYFERQYARRIARVKLEVEHQRELKRCAARFAMKVARQAKESIQHLMETAVFPPEGYSPDFMRGFETGAAALREAASTVIRDNMRAGEFPLLRRMNRALRKAMKAASTKSRAASKAKLAELAEARKQKKSG